MKRPTVLSIAVSDCSGGAGIQVDLKIFTAHKVYGMSVITALTAQNTLGVTAKTYATSLLAKKHGTDYIGSGAWYTTQTNRMPSLLI